MHIDWKFEHHISKTALLHGYMIYFDAFFAGTNKEYVLRTGPEHPATHWYATRLLLEEPIGVNRTQVLPGHLTMEANKEQSFDTRIRVSVPVIGV